MGCGLRTSSSSTGLTIERILLTFKTINKWWGKIRSPLIHGNGLAFFVLGTDNLAFVLQCRSDFIPSSTQQYHLSMPLTIKCYMAGIHSRCLTKWWIPKNFVKKIKIRHPLGGITLWTIWIERNYKVLNKEQWHEHETRPIIWVDLIMYTKVAWAKDVNKIEIKAHLNAFLRGLMKRGVLGMCFVEGMGWLLGGIGNIRVDRVFPSFVLWWFGVVGLRMGGLGDYLWWGSCYGFWFVFV